MLKRTIATIAILLFAAPAALAQGHPTAQCSLNADKSKLVLTVSNGGTGSFACSAQCKYSEASGPALQTFGCNYALNGQTAEKVACDLDGSGPGHFATVRPTSYVCEPR